MTKFDWFKSQVANLTEAEQVDLFNDYVEYVRFHKYGSEYIKLRYKQICPMKKFNDVFKDKTPLEIVEMCNKYRIDTKDNYFAVGFYGIKTLNDIATYISHYYANIFKYEDVWKYYINENNWKVA